MTSSEANAVLRVARIVSRSLDQLQTPDRIAVLESLSVLLPEDESIAARQTAFMLRKAEEAQLKFSDLLSAAALQPEPRTR